MNTELNQRLDTEIGEGPVAGLTDAIPNRLARQTPNYDVEYGVRADDQAMIYHFYPPGTDWSSYPPVNLGKWDPNFRMHERLEAAIAETFTLPDVKGSFTEETRSFCIIVKGLGASLDPDYFTKRFFTSIDAPR